MQQELFLLQEEARVSKRKPYETLQGQVFLFPTSFKQELNGLSYYKQVYTNLGLSQSNKNYTNSQTLGFPSPIRIIQTHKQIVFQNKNIVGYRLKTHKLDRSRHLSSFNKSRQIEILSRRYRGLQICTFLEQFLSSLHVFNLTTCNDHLEPTQIYSNTNKVHFVKGYANYIKICPQQK